MDILDDMGVSKLSAKIFLKVNYSFKGCVCPLDGTRELYTNSSQIAILAWLLDYCHNNKHYFQSIANAQMLWFVSFIICIEQ